MTLLNLFLTFSCMLSAIDYSTKIEILISKSGWNIIETNNKNAKDNKQILNTLLHYNPELDVRVLSVAWVESRLKTKIKRGDSGKACGIFQIHARYSYPYLRRKKGFIGWNASESKDLIEKECKRLETVRYSIKTMLKYIDIMDKKDLHICHHNSGFKGRCNSSYKKKIDFWNYFFEISRLTCKYPYIQSLIEKKEGKNKHEKILKLVIDIMKKDNLIKMN